MNELEVVKMECEAITRDLELRFTQRSGGSLMERLIDVNKGFDSMLPPLRIKNDGIWLLIVQCQTLAQQIEQKKSKLAERVDEVGRWSDLCTADCEFTYFSKTVDKTKVHYFDWPLPVGKQELNRYFKKYLGIELEV